MIRREASLVILVVIIITQSVYSDSDATKQQHPGAGGKGITQWTMPEGTKDIRYWGNVIVDDALVPVPTPPPPPPCVFRGVEVGHVLLGPECDALVKIGDEACAPLWPPRPTIQAANFELMCIRTGMQRKIHAAAESTRYAPLECEIVEGFVLRTGQWTRERCDQARKSFQYCLKYEHKIEPCLSYALSTDMPKAEWVEQQAREEELVAKDAQKRREEGHTVFFKWG